MERPRPRRTVARVAAIAPARRPSATLLVLADDTSLVAEACRHARANHQTTIFCVYAPLSGRFPPTHERRALEAAALAALEEGIHLVPMTRVGAGATESILRAAEEIDARVIVMNGVERRRRIAAVLGRRTIRTIRRRLSPQRSILLYD